MSVVVLLAGAAGAASLSSAAGSAASGGHRARTCPHPAVHVPANEPVYRSGPTELVSCLYVQGGPRPRPPCQPQPRGPYAGTVRVQNPHTGKTVARQSVKNGRLAHIRLAAGSYQVTGRFSGGYTTPPVRVRVKKGYKVRQDLFENVP